MEQWRSKSFSHERTEANCAGHTAKKEKKYGFGEFMVRSFGRLCFICKWKWDAATKRFFIKFTAENGAIVCVCARRNPYDSYDHKIDTYAIILKVRCVESLLINVDRRFALFTQSVSIDTIFYRMNRNLYTFFFFCCIHFVAFVSCIATGHCSLHQWMRRNDDKKRREIVYHNCS